MAPVPRPRLCFSRAVLSLSGRCGFTRASVLRMQTAPYQRIQSISSSSVLHQEKLTLSYCHNVYPKPFIGDTIGRKLDKTADKFPDREAYVFCEDNDRATFSKFKEEVDRLAAGLLSLGLRRGDRVGMWGPNMRAWVLTQFATAKAGLIQVNINPAYQASEAEYALNKVGCKALIMADTHKTQDYYQMMCNVARELSSSKPGDLLSEKTPHLKSVIVAGQTGEKFSGTFSFDEVMAMGGSNEKQQVTNLQMELQSDDPINIQYTSGTTGNPKGATLCHHSILNNAFFCGEILDYEQPTKVCIPVPLYHCFGMVLGSLCSITHGITAVYPSRGFDPGAVLRAVQQERWLANYMLCNSLYGTPTMFIDVLNHPEFEKFDVSSLRTGVMAGSPCPIEVMKEIRSKMNMQDVTIAYGLTETSPVTNQTLMSDPVELRVSTVGRVHPNTEAKIVDLDGRVVPVNTPGEICFRGYCVMLGYWDDQEKTDACIRDNGWFHSGDLATMDENGFIRIIGRLKDVIIRGGENIYPTEIEQFLYKHPKVQDVQVIGVPDERLGEEVCAMIRLQPGETATAEEIKEFCKGQIAHYKIPRYVKFVDEFPLTVTGKVKKFVMREQVKEQLGL